MGRAKLNMELIKKEKSRNITFKKRKEGLVRKMHEFTTLCDVDACMIIYGPKQENGPNVPEIWPQNPEEVHRLIEIYKSKKKESGNKTFGLNDFFQERKRKIEDELTKVRKRNMEAKYPTPFNLIQTSREGWLREFASDLRNKADLVRSKIDELKTSETKQDVNYQIYPPVMNDKHVPAVYYPTLDHVHSVNRNSTMMLLMNGGDQFGGASSSNGPNFQFASFKQQIFYEASVRPPLYYTPPVPLPLPLPPPPPYMVAPPRLPFSAGCENQESAREDIVQYHMNNFGG